MKRHIYIFDYIRALAAIGVVVFHYTARYDQIYTHVDHNYFNFPWGYMGVTTFFILSGFLSTSNLTGSVSPKRWGGNRVVRLFPIYWVSMLITFCATKFWLPDRSVSFPSFIVNLTMLNELFGIGSVDGAYWTLRYEITLYLIVFLVLAFNKLDRIKEIFWGWLAIVFALDIVGKITVVPHFLMNALLSQYIGAFVIGITLGTIYRTKKHNSADFFMILISAAYFGIKNGIQYTIYLVLVTGIFTLITLNEAIRTWKAPKYVHRILMFFAGISYPLYLIHQNLGYIIISRFEMAGSSAILSISTAIFTVILLAYILNALDQYFLNPMCKRVLGDKIQ